MAQRDPKTFAIIGAAMEVHRELGPGFLEVVYQEALAHELSLRQIPFQREVDLPIHYKDHRLNTVYRADFVCHGTIVVELKALTRLSGLEEAQIINYLKAADLEIGLLLNFGTSSLAYKRFIYSKSKPRTKKYADKE
jgi:GxxExxY protein